MQASTSHSATGGSVTVISAPEARGGGIRRPGREKRRCYIGVGISPQVEPRISADENRNRIRDAGVVMEGHEVLVTRKSSVEGSLRLYQVWPIRRAHLTRQCLQRQQDCCLAIATSRSLLR